MKPPRTRRPSATTKVFPPGRPRGWQLAKAPLAALLVTLLLSGARAQAPGGTGYLIPRPEAFAALKTLKLPAPPAWSAPVSAEAWTREQLEAEFLKVTDTPPQVNSTHATLLRPGHAWLMSFKGWFRTLEKPLKIRFEDELRDCDDYANCFVMFADLLTLKSGETRGALCVGWATVRYLRPFAGIRDNVHAVVIVGTSEGLFVIEPQDGTMVALRGFPNRDTIEAVYF